MAKVFTITPGLENMGAMKTGGQGSVYKGRRIGEVITAIKILPTPIYSETAEDKNFIAFQNEVEKLKKVNEQPNPNVVKILSSGLTETGNLPFIEMEFIKGPDLEELLKAPNDPIFTVKEVLKVAEQLSHAMAHCHKLDVKHGDIKSNNVKFNADTSNYVLLDFGLAIMSDEQRRSSLRQAGAIEFMAPEQNTGQMLFQTDVYSFGVVLFELLAGSVPFPLKDRGESARNEVRLAHMVTPLPDILSMRKLAVPGTWDYSKKEHEMQVPEWLVRMVYRCLEKKPEARFANGIELYNYISENYVSPNNNAETAKRIATLEIENKQLLTYQERLQKQVAQYRQDLSDKDDELNRVKAELRQKNSELQLLKDKGSAPSKTGSSQKGVPVRTYMSLLIFTIVLSAFLFFSFLKSHNSDALSDSPKVPVNDKNTNANTVKTAKVKPVLKSQTIAKRSAAIKENKTVVKQQQPASPNNKTAAISKPINEKDKPSVANTKQVTQQQKPAKEPAKPEKQQNDQAEETTIIPETQNTGRETDQPAKKYEENDEPEIISNRRVIKTYLVVAKAYFYNKPDERSRRNSFIGPWEKAVVDALDEKYGFVYVIIKNPRGEIFKGWLRKKDLKLHSIE